jgi:hypothetical protein
MATEKNGELIERARAGLREDLPETPLDQSAQKLVVFPQDSLANPPEDGEIRALRYEEFLAYVDDLTKRD